MKYILNLPTLALAFVITIFTSTSALAGACSAAAGIYNNYGYNCRLLWSGYYACSGEGGFDWRLMERGVKCVGEETLPSIWKDFDPREKNIIDRPLPKIRPTKFVR